MKLYGIICMFSFPFFLFLSDLPTPSTSENVYVVLEGTSPEHHTVMPQKIKCKFINVTI